MAMKRTKYIILFSAALFVSCSSGKWLDVSAAVNVEELMKKECPDLYARYKKTSFKLKNGSEFFSNINFDLITRAAIVYNNGKYYAGASLVSHTYSYNKSSLAILNGFGVINVYVGFNFWRRD